MVSENIIANQKTAFSASQSLLLKASALYFKRSSFTKNKRTPKRISLPLLCVLSITAVSCHQHHKYDWIPTECAPKDYPVRIFSGNFFYGNGQSVPIPNGRFVNYGWGEDGSTELIGEKLKEAPDKFEITWLSYTENKTYTGSFTLDRERINHLFEKGYKDGNVTKTADTFDEIKIGMAPGGLIVLWISGPGGQIEIGHYKAHQTIDIDWKKELPNVNVSMDEYVSIIVADLPDEVRSQIKNNTIPLATWDKWRKRYSWNTIVNKDCKPEKTFTEYFNAEKTLNPANEKLQPEIGHPAVPKRIYVVWKDVKNNSMRTDINFDEQEIFNAFEHLKDGENGELSITINPDSGDAVIKLKTKEKEILLKKTNINTVLR